MIERILLAVSETGHAEEMLKVLGTAIYSTADVTVLHVVPAQATVGVMTAKWEKEVIFWLLPWSLNLDPPCFFDSTTRTQRCRLPGS